MKKVFGYIKNTMLSKNIYINIYTVVKLKKQILNIAFEI